MNSRIEHHSGSFAFARDGNDDASRVNFSDTMIGAVGDKQASVLCDRDLLGSVEFGFRSLSAIAIVTLLSRSDDGCDHTSTNHPNPIVAAVGNKKRASGVKL